MRPRAGCSPRAGWALVRRSSCASAPLDGPTRSTTYQRRSISEASAVVPAATRPRKAVVARAFVQVPTYVLPCCPCTLLPQLACLITEFRLSVSVVNGSVREGIFFDPPKDIEPHATSFQDVPMGFPPRFCHSVGQSGRVETTLTMGVAVPSSAASILPKPRKDRQLVLHPGQEKESS